MGRFRASRDVPLPYDIPSPNIRRGVEDTLLEQDENAAPPSPEIERRPRTTGADLEHAPSSGNIRRRGTADDVADDDTATPIQRGIARVGTILGAAHAQDFERRRRPGVVGQSNTDMDGDDDGKGNSSDDEEDDEVDGSAEGDSDERDVEVAEDIIRRQRSKSGEPVGV